MKIISITEEFVRVEYKLEEIPLYTIVIPSLENISATVHGLLNDPPKYITFTTTTFMFCWWENENPDIAVYQKVNRE